MQFSQILQAYLPSMIKKNYGHIVALSSIAGIVGLPNLVPYSASKHAVKGKSDLFFIYLSEINDLTLEIPKRFKLISIFQA